MRLNDNNSFIGINPPYQHELDRGLTANIVIHYHANIRKCQQPALRQRREPEGNPRVARSQ